MSNPTMSQHQSPPRSLGTESPFAGLSKETQDSKPQSLGGQPSDAVQGLDASSTPPQLSIDTNVDLRIHDENRNRRCQRNAAAKAVDAALLLANPNHDPTTLNPVREIYMTESVSKLQYVYSDLRQFDGGRAYGAIRKWAEETMGINKSQLDVMDTIQKAPRLTGCVGPPGTGKTTTLSLLVISLVVNARKVAFCGPSEACVNQSVNQLCEDDANWKAYAISNHIKGVTRRRKYLRLQHDGAEIRAMDLIDQDSNAKEEESSRGLQAREDDSFEDDPLAAISMAKIIVEQLQLEAELQELQDQAAAAEKEDLRQQIEQEGHEVDRLAKALEHYVWALRELRKRKSLVESRVPLGMTAAWHLFWQSYHDEQAALEETHAIEVAYQEHKNQQELDAGVAAGLFEVNDELYKAFQTPAMTNTEAQAQFGNNSGQNAPWQKRDRSGRFKELRARYIKPRGDLSQAEKQEFRNEWHNAMRRIVADADVIFGTCDTFGSDVLEELFHPSVLICDEAAQARLATVAIPMTTFQGWQAVYLFGDPRQLLPSSPAGAKHEFLEVGKLSALGWLNDKGFPLLSLDTQYRMDPNIAEFPGAHFYGGKMKNSESTREENDEREAVSTINRNRYGIQTSSRYLVIDVVNGISRVRDGSNSSQNHANANSIVAYVMHLYKAGISPSKITILTYYIDQKFLIRTKLHEMCKEHGKDWGVEKIAFKTVDSFHSQENSIILLDFVIASAKATVNMPHVPRHFKATDEKHAEDDDEDGPEFTTKQQRAAAAVADNPEYVVTKGPYLSSFVTDTHRLATALTRSKDGLVVFCNTNTIRVAARRRKSGGVQSLAALVNDARDRQLLYRDTTSMDS